MLTTHNQQSEIYAAQPRRNPQSSDWFNRIPKVGLHLHLEGAIPLPALWQLVEKYGTAPELTNLADLERIFAFRDFPHFIETWVWKNQFLREYEDFTWIAAAVASDLAAQNVLYAEVFLSPSDFFRHGLELPRLVEAVRLGLDQVPGIPIRLVIDLVRDNPPGKAAAILAQAAELRGLGVIGVGIGGSEQLYPPEPFAPVFAEARRLGLHTTAHAGEAAGADSIWGAVRHLKAERIGHGTRAFEDPALVETLVQTQIPLEMCPISNVCTGVVSRLEEHPIRAYFERGMLVTVNTDDPHMFGSSLALEYRMLVQKLGFTHDDIRTLIKNGVRASWLVQEAKNQLMQSIETDPAWRPEKV